MSPVDKAVVVFAAFFAATVIVFAVAISAAGVARAMRPTDAADGGQ